MRTGNRTAGAPGRPTSRSRLHRQSDGRTPHAGSRKLLYPGGEESALLAHRGQRCATCLSGNRRSLGNRNLGKLKMAKEPNELRSEGQGRIGSINHLRLTVTDILFGDGILRSLLRRVSLAKSISALV